MQNETLWNDVSHFSPFLPPTISSTWYFSICIAKLNTPTNNDNDEKNWHIYVNTVCIEKSIALYESNNFNAKSH